MSGNPRVAIVHEWLTSMRGGEKCVEALCDLFPDAVVFALVHHRGTVSAAIERHEIRTSFIQRIPFLGHQFRKLLPLFPTAVEHLDLREFDIVISSNHCVAKGVRTRPQSLHLCYCYTPMRYIWDMYDEYFGGGRAGVATTLGMKLAVGYLRAWDLRTASNPHRFIAISEHVRRRIRQIYHRPSDLIYPPVNVEALGVSTHDEGFSLIVSALVPYKRVDLAVEAFNGSGKRLVVVGDGPDLVRLRGAARKNVEFLGWQSDETVRDLYARCSRVIFPGEEDFGIVPVEAIACGKPVVAFARGGALETVVDGPDVRTGVLFHEQTPAALNEAVLRCEQTTFNGGAMRAFSEKFSEARFKSAVSDYIRQRWEEFKEGRLQPQE